MSRGYKNNIDLKRNKRMCRNGEPSDKVKIIEISELESVIEGLIGNF